MKRVKLWFILSLIGLSFAGCGEGNPGQEAGVSAGSVSGTIEMTDAADATDTVPHEHFFVYVENGDGTHHIVCDGEKCEYSEQEECALDENYVCVSCGYAHEHEKSVLANNDGTHLVTCIGCDYAENTACIPDESYTCKECGWIQEHDCVYEHYECQICKAAYPWEQDIRYFDETLYYAQKELNIYKYPDLESEVTGTLGVDEGVYCVGAISVNGQGYFVTKEGGCVPNSYNYNSNRNDLREAKTGQVVVKYMTLSGDTWSSLKPYAVYDSFDAALLDLCGSSWSHIKANWTYNDYKSQGLPFMNCYAEGASGKTVSTRNLSDPYNYSTGTISYYFE